MPNITTKPIQRVAPGQGVTAAEHNALVDAINVFLGNVSGDEFIDGYCAGGTLHLRMIKRIRLAGTDQMIIKEVHGDYLTCHYWDDPALGSVPGTPVEGTIDIYVGKSFLLRRSPFDGKTRNGITYAYSTDILRTATNGTTTETHVVAPAYTIGDIIIVDTNLPRGLGLTDPNGNRIVWYDTNDGGRVWSIQATP